MEKTDFKPRPVEENVLPRTLVIKPLKYLRSATSAEITFFGVYGGQDENVWTATFYNEDEAKAWVIANNHFGRPVKGALVGVSNDAAGIQSGTVSSEVDEVGGGNIAKTH
jgi:hypothetical protein